MKQFPVLYKKTSTGAIQVWSIAVDENVIYTSYGQLYGKIQVTSDEITEGKNLGRSNATTPEQQALLEAQSQWEKKRKKHYVESIADAQNSVVDETVIQGGVLPMLAQSYSKHGAKIKFPCVAQPKLDGHRCIAVIQNNKVSLWSRTQKPITGVPHIIEQLESLKLGNCVLDGELYNHAYKDRFEQLTSFIRQVTPKHGHEVVEYHVYDCVADAPYMGRHMALQQMKFGRTESIKLVSTLEIEEPDDVTVILSVLLEHGYEGAMLRNMNSPYVHKRSYDLQKVKEFDDAEFPIIRVESGRGMMSDKAIFVCQTPEGEEFRVKMKGALEDLVAYKSNPELAIGKQLTVQYQGMTNSGIPRFPIGLRLRQEV